MDTKSALIGIAFGLIASVPTSLLIVWAMRQRDKALDIEFFNNLKEIKIIFPKDE